MATSGTFLLRMEPGILDKVRYIAKKNKRSINKEIEFVMNEHIEEYEKQHGEISLPLEQED